MITCPKCNATLPDWTQTCQFCQTDVRKIARPAPVVRQQRGVTPSASWVWPCYYAMCAFFVLEGVAGIIQTVIASHHKVLGQEVGFDGTSFVSMGVEGLTILIGLGLALRIEIFRGIVNFFCGLRIFFGILQLAGFLLGSVFAGALAIPFILLALLDIGTGGFMMFLIGETDKSAPNI